MIQHIVLWKLLDEANGKSKTENMERMCDELNALKDLVPQIRTLSMEKNIRETDRNADIALITSFDSLEDLGAYTIHPEHVKVARFVGSVVSSRLAVDFEF